MIYTLPYCSTLSDGSEWYLRDDDGDTLCRVNLQLNPDNLPAASIRTWLQLRGLSLPPRCRHMKLLQAVWMEIKATCPLEHCLPFTAVGQLSAAELAATLQAFHPSDTSSTSNLGVDGDDAAVADATSLERSAMMGVAGIATTSTTVARASAGTKRPQDPELPSPAGDHNSSDRDMNGSPEASAWLAHLLRPWRFFSGGASTSAPLPVKASAGTSAAGASTSAAPAADISPAPKRTKLGRSVTGAAADSVLGDQANQAVLQFPFLRWENNMCCADSTLLILAAIRKAVGHSNWLDGEKLDVHSLVMRAAGHVSACIEGALVRGCLLDNQQLKELQDQLVSQLLLNKVKLPGGTYSWMAACMCMMSLH